MPDPIKNPEQDPDNYIWGIFYYNRDDKRIFPPKSNPAMGFTTNFAQPASVVALLVFVAFVLFVVYMIGNGNSR